MAETDRNVGISFPLVDTWPITLIDKEKTHGDFPPCRKTGPAGDAD